MGDVVEGGYVFACDVSGSEDGETHFLIVHEVHLLADLMKLQYGALELRLRRRPKLRRRRGKTFGWQAAVPARRISTWS